MSIKLRLTIMNFLQFFVWGAWLITIANYWFGTKSWDGTQFGAIFATMGIASLFMPTLIGIIADRWVNAEKLYSLLHFLYAICLIYLAQVDNPSTFFTVILAAMCCYMPTLALSNSIAYSSLTAAKYDLIKAFPPIRVWGTVGFIAAMWITNLSGNKATEFQFYIAAAGSIALAVYSIFMIPKCPPQRLIKENAKWTELLGLEAFKLFANYKMALFFIFSMFLGAALQLTNAYGDVFLSEFAFYPKYASSLVVEGSTIIMSISQISETLFILAIPFFLKRFGIRNVMLFAMVAWVLRFGLFAYGNPSDGLWMIILSCVVYGLAFDFFNISGSLFVESSTDSKIRSSAQGLFMMMTNGFGAVFGSISSGWLIDKYFTHGYSNANELANRLETTVDNSKFLEFISSRGINIENGLFNEIINLKDWHSIWLAFAAYTLIIVIAFALLFKHKHNPNDIEGVNH
ncbi:NHS family xanthosine MFS transporter [Sphingobacterium alimentarium]|uniref:NHS family xanthosine MFS transporter n=1 Tax=Sphingobacterium alimentarium TaxID=797292 RepID=A0A4R3VY12_9SPHI|nr:nucleoside permease [Sphingobacterium alimentarium]TCV13652.1 NHS family xanthosine MFS transporter [Sphingobacterium alimentarium]